MSIAVILRNIGPTYALSVTASATTAIPIVQTSNEVQALSSFLNTGATTVAVNIFPTASGTAPAAVLPVAGTPQQVIVLPPSMNYPVIYATPQNYSVTAIGTGAGPALVYITPVALQ